MTQRQRAIDPRTFIKAELKERNWSQRQLAKRMKRPYQAINEILKGRKIITAQTAIELGKAFGTSAELWMNLESNYRLKKARIRT